MNIRNLTAALILGLSTALTASAQAVVVDPTQIAASAINVMDQIDYAIDQITELADMGGKLGTLKSHLDNVFGDDGIGTQVLGLLQDLGTLDRLTESYNRSLTMAAAYAKRMKDTGTYRLADVNMILNYLNTSRNTAELAVETAKKLLSAVGLSKAEKKEEVDKLIDELERRTEEMSAAMGVELEASAAAEGICELMDIIDSNTGSEEYVSELQKYGTQSAAAGGAIGLVTLLLGILGILSCTWGLIVYLRGGISGDPTAENILLRIGVGIFVGIFILNIISSIVHLNL